MHLPPHVGDKANESALHPKASSPFVRIFSPLLSLAHSAAGCAQIGLARFRANRILVIQRAVIDMVRPAALRAFYRDLISDRE